jgi:hypothetical protein
MSETLSYNAMDDDNGANYPKCTVRCTKIIGHDSNDNPIYCSKTCSKTATPNHELYGTHYCSEHA